MIIGSGLVLLLCLPMSASAFTMADEAGDVFRGNGTIVGGHSYMDIRDLTFNDDCELLLRMWGAIDDFPGSWIMLLVIFLVPCDEGENGTAIVGMSMGDEGMMYAVRLNTTEMSTNMSEFFDDFDPTGYEEFYILDEPSYPDDDTVLISDNCSMFPSEICNATVFLACGDIAADDWDDLYLDIMPNSIIGDLPPGTFGDDFDPDNYEESATTTSDLWTTYLLVFYLLLYLGVVAVVSFNARRKPGEPGN